MARLQMQRWRQLAVQWLGGAAGLAAAAWLARDAVLGLVPYEEPLGQFWFVIYLYVGWFTGALLAAIAVLAALHLWMHGREDVRPRGPADAVAWWSLAERGLHWAFVLSFVLLLGTGIQLYLAGPGLPSALTRTMRRWHADEPFIVLGSLLFLAWCRDALPRRYDVRWIAHVGGYLRRGEPLPAGRFNAGQKLWFWLESFAALVMAVTGYQLAHHFSRMDDGYLTVLALHLAAAALFLAVLAVHFYLAVVGVRGALGGMIHGCIGREGARRLHSEAAALRSLEGPDATP